MWLGSSAWRQYRRQGSESQISNIENRQPVLVVLGAAGLLYFAMGVCCCFRGEGEGEGGSLKGSGWAERAAPFNRPGER